MHSLLGLAGVLGLVAFAFGEGAAVRLAQAIIVVVLLLVVAVVADKSTQGAISDYLVPRGRTCFSDCP